MSEPEYTYIKGHGWVPAFYETASQVIGKYRVTLINRLPELGEYGFNRLCEGHAPLSKEFQYMTERKITGAIQSGSYNGAGWLCDERNYKITRDPTGVYGPATQWCTSIVELI